MLAVDILLLWSGHKSWDPFHTLLSKGRPTFINRTCYTLAALLMLYSTQIISEDPFLPGALYPENNHLKSAVIGGSNPQNPRSGYDTAAVFRWVSCSQCLVLLHSEFSRPGCIAKFVTCGHQEQIKRRTAILWVEISVSVLLKNRFACTQAS